jgi:hypothetical protein
MTFVDGDLLYASQLNSLLQMADGAVAAGVTAQAAATAATATVAAATAHIANTSNPHATTAAQVNFTPAGTSAVVRTVSSRFGDVISLKDFGAVGNGSTDDTSPFSLAVNAAAGKTLYVPEGTYIISSKTLPNAGISIVGAGPGSILKQKAATDSHFLTMATASAGATFAFRNLCIDGNTANQTDDGTHERRGLNWAAPGTASAASVLQVESCLFINGRSVDIYAIIADGTDTNRQILIVRGCRFWGGCDGSTSFDPRYISVQGAVESIIEGNSFDFGRVPTGSGRAGVVGFGASGTVLSGRASWTGNVFRNVGRSETLRSLGALDYYSHGLGVTIAGNTLYNTYGRAIQCKSDSGAVTVTGNTVEGLTAPPGYVNGLIGAQIVVNRATSTTQGGGVTISGNTCRDSGNIGISLNGEDTTGVTRAKSHLIVGNVIQGATGPAIDARTVDGAVISNNAIDTCGDVGINLLDLRGLVSVRGNIINGTTLDGINHGASANRSAQLDVSGNMLSNVAGDAIDLATFAGGSIKGNTILAPTGSSIRVGTTTALVTISGNDIPSGKPIVTPSSNTLLRVDASGTGSPEAVVVGIIGSTYTRTDGGAGTSFYVKESGGSNVNTGWAAK